MKNSSNDFVLRYNEYEDSLIREFHRHRFFQNFRGHTNETVIRFLLQLGYLSAEFVKWYERAKQGFEAEDAKEMVRHILRDEIPQGAPTHQDERIYDLEHMGVPKKRALNTAASPFTRSTVKKLYELVGYPQADYDLRVLITLRIFGEILVAETYSYVVGSMGVRFSLTAEQSRFYAPHYYHDQKEGVGDGHTGEFDALLARLICDEQKLTVAKDAAHKAFEARCEFHNQFITSYRFTSAFRQIAAVAACIALMVFVGINANGFYKKAAREGARQGWMVFFASIEPQGREFYLDCDRRLAEQAHRTSNLAYLQKVGTPEACGECWGDGP